MIEVELKYKISSVPDNITKLKLLKSKSQTDYYYDTPDYHLISNGNFLRVRNNKSLEFKLNVNDLSHLYCKELDFELNEIDDKKSQISSILSEILYKNDQNFENFENLVDAYNLILLAPIVKSRREFEIEPNLHICIDEVEDLGVFLEAEIMIDKDNISDDEAQTYKQLLSSKLVENKLICADDQMVSVGYVELYLKEHNPEAYNLGLYK